MYDNVINAPNTQRPVCGGAIVLSHDIYESTAEAYDAIIKELKRQGRIPKLLRVQITASYRRFAPCERVRVPPAIPPPKKNGEIS